MITVGFRVHTGWAAAVALGGTASEPRVIDRRRILLAPPAETEELQAYHLAAEQPFAKAEWMIEAALDTATKATRVSIAAWVKELGASERSRAPVARGRERADYKVNRAAIVAGNTELPESLETILASHALIHAAEGAMFRQAIALACSAQDIAVSQFPGNALTDLAASVLGLTAGKLRDRLAAFGKALGPPWAQDQKDATLVAWLALAQRRAVR